MLSSEQKSSASFSPKNWGEEGVDAHKLSNALLSTVLRVQQLLCDYFNLSFFLFHSKVWTLWRWQQVFLRQQRHEKALCKEAKILVVSLTNKLTHLHFNPSWWLFFLYLSWSYYFINVICVLQLQYWVLCIFSQLPKGR